MNQEQPIENSGRREHDKSGGKDDLSSFEMSVEETLRSINPCAARSSKPLEEEVIHNLRDGLGTALLSPDWHDLERAIQFIGEIGPAAKELAVDMRGLFKHSSIPPVQYAAMRALAEIAPYEESTSEFLKEQLIGNLNPTVRRIAAECLEKICDSRTTSALEVAADEQYEPSMQVREAARRALETIHSKTTAWAV